MAVTVMIQLVFRFRVSDVLRDLCKDFLRPSMQGLQCWALSLHPADRQVLSKTGHKPKCDLRNSALHSSVKHHRILGQSSWRRGTADSYISRVFGGDKGCSGRNWGEQFGAFRSSPLRSLSRSWSRSRVSGRRPEKRPLGQHSKSKTRREVWRAQ